MICGRIALAFTILFPNLVTSLALAGLGTRRPRRSMAQLVGFCELAVSGDDAEIVVEMFTELGEDPVSPAYPCSLRTSLHLLLYSYYTGWSGTDGRATRRAGQVPAAGASPGALSRTRSQSPLLTFLLFRRAARRPTSDETLVRTDGDVVPGELRPVKVGSSSIPAELSDLPSQEANLPGSALGEIRQPILLLYVRLSVDPHLDHGLTRISESRFAGRE